MMIKLKKISAASSCAALLTVTIGLAAPPGASADDAYAESQLKVMSDYLAGENAISFGYDVDIEVITAEQQKLALASSGTLVLNRPDKVRITRSGGFASQISVHSSTCREPSTT